MSNKYSELAEIEEQIASLAAKNFKSDSPQMRSLHLKRSKVAAMVAPNIATMSLAQLKQERTELLALIKKQRRNPLLCDPTLAMLKRRNLALKDTIKLRERESLNVKEAA